VIQVKYAEGIKRFGEEDETMLVATVQAIILRIKVITGWPIPELEEERNILYAELTKHFREAWPTLNAEEVMYAIRSYTGVVKNWGKDINLALIDEALAKYYQHRQQVSLLEEQAAVKRDAPQLPPAEADWKEMCEACYQEFLTGKYNLSLWPWQMYDEFVKCDMMEAEFYLNAQEAAEIHLLSKHRGQIVKEELTGSQVSVRELQAKIEAINSKQSIEVINLAKKMAVRYLYQQAKKQKIDHLFVKTEE